MKPLLHVINTDDVEELPINDVKSLSCRSGSGKNQEYAEEECLDLNTADTVLPPPAGTGECEVVKGKGI